MDMRFLGVQIPYRFTFPDYDILKKYMMKIRPKIYPYYPNFDCKINTGNKENLTKSSKLNKLLVQILFTSSNTNSK